MLRRSFAIALAPFLLLASHLPGAVDRVILGYSAAWQDSLNRPVDYAFGSMTHIARAFLQPHPDGSIGVPDGYFDPQLESLAHAKGVKLLMSAGGEAENDDNWVSIATHPEYLKRFLGELTVLLRDHHYDGIDVDWEPAPLTFADADAYTALLTALRAAFPSAVLTTALPAGEYWINHLKWEPVLRNVDYINVMTYDYSGAWGGVAAHASNLFPPAAYHPKPGNSAAEGMQNLISNHHLPASKLLMGLTFWGYRFRADRIGDAFPADTKGYEDNLCFEQIDDLLRTDHYEALWDQHAAMPYLQRVGGGCVVCYENPESIRRKCDYARAAGCAGLMIWSIGADVCGNHAPLMDAVAQANGGVAALLDRAALEQQILNLQKTLRQGGKTAPGKRAPATTDEGISSAALGALTQPQLEDVYAKAQQSCGQFIDRTWRDRVISSDRK